MSEYKKDKIETKLTKLNAQRDAYNRARMGVLDTGVGQQVDGNLPTASQVKGQSSGLTSSGDIETKEQVQPGINNANSTAGREQGENSDLVPIAGGLYVDTKTGEVVDGYNYVGNGGGQKPIFDAAAAGGGLVFGAMVAILTLVVGDALDEKGLWEKTANALEPYIDSENTLSVWVHDDRVSIYEVEEE